MKVSREKVMQGLWRAWLKDEGGATAIEYALIASFVAMAIVAGAEAVGLDLVNVFTDLTGTLV